MDVKTLVAKCIEMVLKGRAGDLKGASYIAAQLLMEFLAAIPVMQRPVGAASPAMTAMASAENMTVDALFDEVESCCHRHENDTSSGLLIDVLAPIIVVLIRRFLLGF